MAATRRAAGGTRTSSATPTAAPPKPPVSLDAQRAVAAALLEYVPSPMSGGRARPQRSPITFDNPPAGVKVRLSPTEQTNAFLFAVMFDHMIKADAAWIAPYHLAARLGHLDVRRIAAMGEAEIGSALKGRDGQKALHRLWPRLAKNLGLASKLLLGRYAGNAENIWPDGLAIGELTSRLRGVPGVGAKLASMTIRLLIEEHGRRFVGWEKADVAVDRHVARVFLRTGLVQGQAGQWTYSVSELHDDVIAAGRRAHPAYPAALDLPAYHVGAGFCHARTPSCRACPIRSACPRERKAWRIA